MLHICMRVVIVGSAPHMRGIQRFGNEIAGFGRISPAHAGNTVLGVVGVENVADQPRTCGEYRGLRRRQA